MEGYPYHFGYLNILLKLLTSHSHEIITMYRQARNDIWKFNGDFDGLEGLNVSSKDYHANMMKRNQGRTRDTNVVETGKDGFIRAKPMKKSVKKKHAKKPFEEYMTCNGFNAGFQFDEMEKSLVWQ